MAFLAYKATPLGQVALLDAREQQVLAQQMATGQLAAEPWYRSPLWAGILSIFYRVGMNDAGVLWAGQVLNLLLHGVAAWAIGGTAMNLWRDKKAAFIAGALYAMYPVALYLAFDLLDTTLAQALLCGALYFFTRHLTRKKDKAWHALVMSVLLVVMFLARAQLMVVGFGALAILLWMTPEDKLRAARGLWAGLGVFVAALALFGLLEWRRTGHFYILPSQGAYNLWSANRPGATGEYYAQQLELPELPDGQNPARAEALALYRQAHPQEANPTEAQVNSYWKGQFLAHVRQEPGEFAALYAKKLYALLNNHEAYNNKTYSFQKNENGVLRWNPLGFGLISALALVTLLFVRPLPPVLRPLILLGGLLWLFTALFYTSERFRLALVPFVVVIAAAAPVFLARWRTLKRRPTRSQMERVALVVVWTLVFGLPLFGVGATDTTSADRLLIAQAALKVGDDRLAAQQAALTPTSAAQTESLLQAHYNLMLKGEWPVARSNFEEMQKLVDRLSTPSVQARYVAGLCQWQLTGQREVWHQLAAQAMHEQSANTLAALMLTGPLLPEEVMLLNQLKDEEPLPIVMAQASLGSQTCQRKLESRLGADSAATTLAAWRKLFDRVP